MKRMIKQLMIVALGVLFAGAVFAQDVIRDYNAYDAAPILKVQNLDNNILQIKWTGGQTFQVIGGGITNTAITCGTCTTDTVAEVAATMRAYTNNSGLKYLNVEYWCSLGTETLSNKCIVITNTFAPGDKTWNNAGKWDTSGALFYMASISPNDSPKVLKRIDGNVAGTSNVVVDVYTHNDPDDVQTLMGSWTVRSPNYVLWIADGKLTNNPTWADDDMPGYLNMDVNIPAGRKQGIFVRASRASSATTGGIGVTAELRK